MRYLLITLLILFISGCDTSESTESKDSIDNDFPLVETNGSLIKTLFSQSCRPVSKVHYNNEEELKTYWEDIKNKEVYWDTRYTDDKAENICQPHLAFSTVVDTRTRNFNFDFGGPQSTLIYRPSIKSYPWVNNGNLMMQVEFTELNYENLNTNLGGTVSFNLFITNKKTNERLNYVISIYTLNHAWNNEQPDVLFDPSTNTSFINSTVNHGNKYTTISDTSSVMDTDRGFFRTNISNENLITALSSKGIENINLNDWYLNFAGIQFELEEEGGDAVLSGSFNTFELYMTTSPM